MADKGNKRFRESPTTVVGYLVLYDLCCAYEYRGIYSRDWRGLQHGLDLLGGDARLGAIAYRAGRVWKVLEELKYVYVNGGPWSVWELQVQLGLDSLVRYMCEMGADPSTDVL